MTARMWRGISGAIIAAATAGTLAGSAVAQQSTNRVATETDWSVFVEENPQKECWGVSAPKETVNSRGGQTVSVNRGDILLFVTFRPGAGSRGEVSFTGGYPFAPDSTVGVQIGSDTFQLFVDDQWAWPQNAEDDARLLAAMRRGAEAVVTGRSSRGTDTRDTFSLMGFTAAMTEAENRCSN
jgi:invasion protein IalB